MDGMPSYVRPPNLPSEAGMVAAFDALSTAFARGIVHYVATKPGTRIPELTTYFDKHNAAVRVVVVSLEAVGVLQVIPGSERKIGAGFSYAYKVDKDRVKAVMTAQRDYLLGRSGPAVRREVSAPLDASDGDVGASMN